MKYRKQLLDFKYGLLKKGVKLSRRLMESFSEYISMGTVILRRLHGRMKIDKRQSNRFSYTSKSSQSNHWLTMVDQEEENTSSIKNYLECLSDMKKIFLCETGGNFEKVRHQLR